MRENKITLSANKPEDIESCKYYVKADKPCVTQLSINFMHCGAIIGSLKEGDKGKVIFEGDVEASAIIFFNSLTERFNEFIDNIVEKKVKKLSEKPAVEPDDAYRTWRRNLVISTEEMI